MYIANAGMTLGEPLLLSFLYIYEYIYIYMRKQMGHNIPQSASNVKFNFYNYFPIQSLTVVFQHNDILIS